MSDPQTLAKTISFAALHFSVAFPVALSRRERAWPRYVRGAQRAAGGTAHYNSVAS